MNDKVVDCLIENYASLISTLDLPDPNDRHVLAAAIAGRCSTIVTKNLKDFPDSQLSLFGIRAQHPDDFLFAHLKSAPEVFCSAVQKVRARLRNPVYEVSTYLATLIRQELITTAAELVQYSELI